LFGWKSEFEGMNLSGLYMDKRVVWINWWM